MASKRTTALILAVLFAGNEIRGLVLTLPVLYSMWLVGGTLMACWLAFCSIAGIALWVMVPVWIARRMNLRRA